MTLCVNDSGTWRNIASLFVNESGTWRYIRTGCINNSNTWRKFLTGLLGCSCGGGTLICRASNVNWIVAPATSEVTRSWNCRNDAVTRAQQVSGCTGWFIPTCSQLNNPGYTGRTFWDSYSSTCYWSSSERTFHYAWYVNFANGANPFNGSTKGNMCVRAFRCVTY